MSRTSRVRSVFVLRRPGPRLRVHQAAALLPRLVQIPEGAGGFATVPLVAAPGGSEGQFRLDVATLLSPVLSLWATIPGVDAYRRG